MAPFLLRHTVYSITPKYTSNIIQVHLGRNRFVQTGFRFYPETGFGLVVQIKWTVWSTDANRVTVATLVAIFGKRLSLFVFNCDIFRV